ncbi:hypothetical protein GW756_01455 [bacterium]|nr:hypothetical protein [bacterium]NCQ55021.1 hypothetical protein [Candidatus Parcubacteria bacterium]NCS67065.1 hypothetical protein [Candidatus Peregrinibacteria bacterium]NCS96011.1 hypothetical protein [bacterium]
MSCIDRSLSGLQALESVERAVIKIGGDNAGRLIQNANQAINRLKRGVESILVVSAIRSSDENYSKFSHESLASDSGKSREKGFNTTSHLLEIAQRLNEPSIDKKSIHEIIDRIGAFTLEVIEDNVGNVHESLPAIREIVTETITWLRTQVDHFDPESDKIFKLGEDTFIKTKDGNYFTVTGFGEILAEKIYNTYFKSIGINVGSVKTEDLPNRAYDSSEDPEAQFEDRISREKSVLAVRNLVSKRVKSVLKNSESPKVVIVPGYCPALAVNRGYSEMLAAVILAELVKDNRDKVKTALLVEKKVRGVLSINPGLLANPKLAKTVDAIGWDLAEALFGAEYGADAGVVQSDSIPELEQADADVFVFDPENLAEGKVTHIAKHNFRPGGVEIIQPRDGAILEFKYSGVRLRKADREKLQGTFKTWAETKNLVWIDNNSSENRSVRILAGPASQKLTSQDIEELQALFKSEDGLGEDRISVNYNPEVSIMFGLGNNMSKPSISSRVNLALDALSVNRLDLGQVGQQALWYAVDKKREDEIARGLYTLLINTTEEVFWQKDREEGGLESLLDKA